MKRFIKVEQKTEDERIVVIYTDEDGDRYKFSGGTWAWRNHNPGNMEYGDIAKSHGAIGFVKYQMNTFAVFPDEESGRMALIDLLRTTRYMNGNIDFLVSKYAPKKGGNDEVKYRNHLRRKTGIKDDRKIKDFTPQQFEKLRLAIEQFECWKVGKIEKVNIKKAVTQVKKNDHGIICSYFIEGIGWVSKDRGIELAKQGKIDAVVCTSRTGNIFLRSRPDKSLSDNFGNLVEK